MRRGVVLTVALSDNEKARIAAAAERERRTMSQWARLALLDALAASEKAIDAAKV